MNATIEFQPGKYSERSLRLILAKAQEWETTPAEAIGRLLDNLAAKAGFKPRPQAANDEGRAA